MNDYVSYITIRRMRGPALLITVGVTALLDQFHILNYGQSWPLYLIVLGLWKLAENHAFSRAMEQGEYEAQRGYGPPAWATTPAATGPMGPVGPMGPISPMGSTGPIGGQAPSSTPAPSASQEQPGSSLLRLSAQSEEPRR